MEQRKGTAAFVLVTFVPGIKRHEGLAAQPAAVDAAEHVQGSAHLLNIALDVSHWPQYFEKLPQLTPMSPDLLLRICHDEKTA